MNWVSISQKATFFIVTAVKTSNLTKRSSFSETVFAIIPCAGRIILQGSAGLSPGIDHRNCEMGEVPELVSLQNNNGYKLAVAMCSEVITLLRVTIFAPALCALARRLLLRGVHTSEILCWCSVRLRDAVRVVPPPPPPRLFIVCLWLCPVAHIVTVAKQPSLGFRDTLSTTTEFGCYSKESHLNIS
jgi:hypothetical protein